MKTRIPAGKSTANMLIDSDLHKWLRVYAAENAIHMSAVVEEALRQLRASKEEVQRTVEQASPTVLRKIRRRGV